MLLEGTVFSPRNRIVEVKVWNYRQAAPKGRDVKTVQMKGPASEESIINHVLKEQKG